MKTNRFLRALVLCAISALLLAVPPVHAAPGDLDPLNANVVGGSVLATAVQPDGKTILAGSFSSVLGVARQNIARVNADGTLDTGFDPKANSDVNSVAVQPDGKVLLGGTFTTLQPNGAGAATIRNRIARVNADGTLDTGFDPKADNTVYSVAVQADGKVLLGGEFTTLQPNGAATPAARQNIARVNADGTLDTGFDPKANSSVNSVAVQADGKVLLGGFFTTLQPNGAVSTTTRNRIARVNADGTLDTGFDPNANSAVFSLAMQADGKVLLGGAFTTLQPNGAGAATARNRIARVNANGTLDTGFDPKANNFVLSVAVQADGKVLLGGFFNTLQPNGAGAATSRISIARVNADGTLDTGFDPKANNVVRSVAVQADGRVLLGGDFTTLQPNGAGAATARQRFALLLNDLATQTLAAPLPTEAGWGRGGAAPELGRVTFEMSTDGGASWTPLGAGTRVGTTPNWRLTGLSLPASGQLRARGTTSGGYQNGSPGLVEQVVGFPLPPGDLDPLNANVVGDSVLATAVQPDGKIILAGDFTSVLGMPRQGIARLNADGTLDTGFDPKANNVVRSVAVQADGKVLLGGEFTTLQPNGAGAVTTRNRIARVNADGTLDTGFDPKADNTVHSVAVQADGKVLLGGEFMNLQPNGAGVNTARTRIARVNADGTLDTGFDPKANGGVTSVAVQADGKVLLSGGFTTLQPNGAGVATTRNRIARVNADGTLDTDFDPNANSVVFSVAVQADGKVLLGGAFTTLQPNGAGAVTARNGIARVNADGTLDTGFDPKAGGFFPIVYSVAVQADGKVLLGGDFTTLQPNGAGATTTRNRTARVNADGTLDTDFDPNANSVVFSVAVQADGRVLLGGAFTTLQPNGAGAATPRNLFARLVNDPATQTLSVPDATRVLWTRGGSAPEFSRVTFELSTDGGTVWTPLGAGTHVGTTPNWQRTGLSLPATGQIRARGATTGGYQSGSSGLIEQLAAYTVGVEIVVEQPAGTELTDNASTVAFGAVPVGIAAVAKTFTVRNLGGTGGVALTGLAVTGDNAEFAVNATGFPASLAIGASATFTVTFTPAVVGERTATLSIPSSDPDENPFEVALTGRGLSFTADTDGDGLNDAAEFQGAALGFDWQVSQPALVQSLNGMANSAGLFTTAQVQALHIGTPLISRNPATGKFKLTLGLTKTTTLSPPNWLAFPFTEEGTFLNGQGKLEFEFTAPDNAAFFRLEAN